MRIKTANQHPQMQAVGGIQGYVESMIMSAWGQIPDIDWDNPVGGAYAYVLRSNWVVGCPFCEETLFAQPQTSFFCPSCLMGNNDGNTARVYFPKVWKDIEEILMLRPNPMNRNWLLHETINDLLLENELHGDI